MKICWLQNYVRKLRRKIMSWSGVQKCLDQGCPKSVVLKFDKNDVQKGVPKRQVQQWRPKTGSKKGVPKLRLKMASKHCVKKWHQHFALKLRSQGGGGRGKMGLEFTSKTELKKFNSRIASDKSGVTDLCTKMAQKWRPNMTSKWCPKVATTIFVHKQILTMALKNCVQKCGHNIWSKILSSYAVQKGHLK